MATNDPVDAATVQHARNVAAFLHSRGDPALAGFHTLRSQQAGSNERQSHTCRMCGTLLVPGWTGQVRLERNKPGKRSRGKPVPTKKNKLLVTCGCGWQMELAGATQEAKKKSKKSKPVQGNSLAPAEIAREPLSSSFPSPKPTTSSESAISMATKDINPTPLTARPVKATSKPLASSSFSPSPSPAPSPSLPASPAPPTTKASLANVPSKKKRTKKEGLQALLQARKQSEAKEMQAKGGMGLGSFLQGL